MRRTNIIYQLAILNALVFAPAKHLAAQSSFLFGNVDSIYTNIRFTGHSTQIAGSGIYYANSDIGISHRRSGWLWDVVARINQAQSYLIDPGHVVIQLPDTVTLRENGDLRSRAHRYTWNNPFSLIAGRQWNKWYIGTEHQLVSRQEVLKEPILREIGNNGRTYYLEWKTSSRTRYDIWSAAHIGYRWNNLTVDIGMTLIPIVGIGKMPKQFDQQTTLRWRLGLAAQHWGGYSRILWSPDVWSASRTQLWTSRIMTGISMTGERILSPRHIMRVDAGYLHRDRWAFYVAVSSSVEKNESLKRASFEDMLRHIHHGSEGSMTPRAMRPRISAGIVYRLDKTKPPVILRVTRSELLQSNIFASKNSYYAYNPVAFIELYNPETVPVDGQIIAEIEDIGIRFQSEALRWQPGEIKRVPIFLYFDPAIFGEGHLAKQLRIGFEKDTYRYQLSAFPVTIHDRHTWDGNTWGLRYFLTPENPIIRSAAKQLYFSEPDTVVTSDLIKFVRLRNLLEKAGKNLRYIEDPVTTIYADQVQYPEETLVKQSGDCEDISVYIASLCMSVGYACGIVDIRPDQNAGVYPSASGRSSPGHVFLLIDTGLSPEWAERAGFSEFDAIARDNTKGETSLWVPIEATLLHEGFIRAHRDGVRQYYDKVIVQQGVSKGSVHIYDLQ